MKFALDSSRLAKCLATTIISNALFIGCQPSEPMVGDALPEFSLQPLKDSKSKVTSDSLKGKVIVMDFWATWCGPCRMFSPLVEGLADKYAAKGVQFMAVSSEPQQDIAAFEAKTPHKISVFVDPLGGASAALKVNALPTLIIVGKDGTVKFFSAGFDDTTISKMDSILSKEI